MCFESSNLQGTIKGSTVDVTLTIYGEVQINTIVGLVRGNSNLLFLPWWLVLRNSRGMFHKNVELRRRQCAAPERPGKVSCRSPPLRAEAKILQLPYLVKTQPSGAAGQTLEGFKADLKTTKAESVGLCSA